MLGISAGSHNSAIIRAVIVFLFLVDIRIVSYNSNNILPS